MFVDPHASHITMALPLRQDQTLGNPLNLRTLLLTSVLGTFAEKLASSARKIVISAWKATG
jgi:hypothetical protein